MIKKLRHKFIAVNMIFVSIILLIIFIFSFSFTYTGQVHTAEREMERLLFNREVQINNRDIYSPDSIPAV
jgi:ABC-type cobalt transport system substrate-binding protein